MSDDRPLDVVVFGASGFVGKLIARHLAEHAPADARIGLAGRTEQRLADVRAGREAPRPLPRPGLAGAESRGLELPEKPELA